MKFRNLKFLTVVILLLQVHWSFSQTWTNNSVLSSGDWYKLSLDATGVYKISPSFIATNNIGDGSSINIDEIRIYGNGVGILPANSSIFRKDDLQEIPVKRVDVNQNGIFDGSDYILFYAKGPHEWKKASNSNDFGHTINFYRDVNFYFITVGNGQGKEIQSASLNSGIPTNTVISYDDFQFKEDESDNLVGAGRTWVGDLFDFTLQYNYGFNFPDLDLTQPVKVRVNAVARASTGNTRMKVNISSLPIDTLTFSAHGTIQGASYVSGALGKSQFLPNGDNFSVSLIYDNSQNPSGVAWLDYIEIQARRQLFWRANSLGFRDINSVGIGNLSQFKISNANSAVEIWDVTDINKTFSIY